MGLAQRAQAIVDERVRQRYAERAAAERQRQSEADAYHAAYLDRERAAEFLGTSTHKLKRMTSAGTGPACVKNGDSRQATVRWPVDELRAWKADPAAYVAPARDF